MKELLKRKKWWVTKEKLSQPSPNFSGHDLAELILNFSYSIRGYRFLIEDTGLACACKITLLVIYTYIVLTRVHINTGYEHSINAPLTTKSRVLTRSTLEQQTRSKLEQQKG